MALFCSFSAIAWVYVSYIDSIALFLSKLEKQYIEYTYNGSPSTQVSAHIFSA